jgi:hypothetical protein
VAELRDVVAHYIGALHGAGREDALCRLSELGSDAIPYLESAMRSESDPSILALVVEAAWQTRSVQALSVLAPALQHPVPAVWKAALDGIVTLSGPESLKVLLSAMEHTDGEKRDWFEEALEQAQKAGDDGSA